MSHFTTGNQSIVDLSGGRRTPEGVPFREELSQSGHARGLSNPPRDLTQRSRHVTDRGQALSVHPLNTDSRFVVAELSDHPVDRVVPLVRQQQ